MPDDPGATRLTASNLGFFTAINVVVANASAYNKTEGYWEGIYSPANVLGLTLHVGANEDEVIVIDIENVSSVRLGVRDTESGKAISLGTREDAENAIGILDKAIDEVSRRRADLGAYQNRLQSTLNYLGVSEESMTAAESRIRDIDYAKEMSDFVRNQILVQAGIAMMAQANMMPQAVLALLG
ncbi:MAG: flagellin [bacterium]|nr:flagellin [bacterium]